MVSIKKHLSSELGRGTIVLFVMMNIYFFFSFLFHFIMARQLGPADYGVLAVLFSLMYIYGVPTEALQNLVARYTAKFNLKKQDGKIKNLMLRGLKKGFVISIIFFGIGIILAEILAYFLPINFWLFVLANVMIFGSFSLPVVRGVLQGRKKFSLLGYGMITESVLKLLIAVVFVYLGFGVFGAMYGTIFSVLIGFIVSFEFNGKILKSKEKKADFEEARLESVPYFISMFVILLVFGIDVILAKRFFSAEKAGQYAVLSMLGKMIYFGTMSISKVMFPLSSEKHDNNENSLTIFKKTFFVITGLCTAAILLYFLFPKLIVSILYGTEYLSIAPFLIYSAIAFSLLALSNFIFLYKLSIGGLKKSYFLFIYLIIEIILLSIFHGSIKEYIIAFMVSNIIMFIGGLFLLRTAKHEQIKHNNSRI